MNLMDFIFGVVAGVAMFPVAKAGIQYMVDRIRG